MERGCVYGVVLAGASGDSGTSLGTYVVVYASTRRCRQARPFQELRRMNTNRDAVGQIPIVFVASQCDLAVPCAREAYGQCFSGLQSIVLHSHGARRR